jgi:hypothetical protein
MGNIEKLVNAENNFQITIGKMIENLQGVISSKENVDLNIQEFQSIIESTKEGILGLLTENEAIKQNNQTLKNIIAQLQSQGGVSQPGPDEVSKLEIVFKPGQENKGWGDGIFYKNNESKSTLKETLIVCGGRSGIVNNKGVPIVLDWDGLVFTQGPYQTGWGTLMNDVSGSIKNCTFVALGSTQFVKDPHSTDGHPVYFKPTGDLLFEGNKFLDCGGNTQIVGRPWEAAVPEKLKIEMINNLWSNCSWNPAGHGGGGSSNVAIYSATNEGTEVFVKDSIWHNAVNWVDFAKAKVGASARACLTLWNEAYFPSAGLQETGQAKDGDKFFAVLSMEGCLIRTTQGDRSVIDIEGTREIYIRSLQLEFIGEMNERPFMTIDKRPVEDNPQRAKRILIEPIDADGYMEINGEKVELRDGYDWIEEGYVAEYEV